jgi:hypothetical protein
LRADDADALFAFLRSLPPVAQPNRPHALRLPYGTQLALTLWRALHLRPEGAARRAGPAAELARARLCGPAGACRGRGAELHPQGQGRSHRRVQALDVQRRRSSVRR